MERESFEDQEVAKVLNEHYVAVKVDREERPDIDSVYMSVCQALTGHGGWPLTIIMTPDKKPFFAGTYFPKDGSHGYPGLVALLERIKDAWKNNREELIENSERITEAIRMSPVAGDRGEIGKDIIENAFRSFKSMYDKIHGGFGTAPKFPTPHNLMFLLRYWKNYGEKEALGMVERTLEAMYKGGIFDHVGFGFSRYSTDSKWLVPHFEKMLYDNALLAIAYTEAYQATGRILYRRVAERIFTYVIRDMAAPGGGFYSAEDADSEGEEGKFYVWDPDEVEAVVGSEDARLYCGQYDIKPGGNFEGRSIPNLIGKDPEAIEQDYETFQRLENIRQKLFNHRENRTRPFRDDKILTSWNGLMIAAMSYAGRVLKRIDYIEHAEAAVGFIYSNLFREDGRLLARYRDGEAAYPAYLDDYAFLTWGLMELYQATFKPVYLKRAIELNSAMLELFWDKELGGLFLTGNDSEELIIRPKEAYDGALPSGNSVAALNMLRLAAMTEDTELREKAEAQLKAFAAEVTSTPYSHSFFMMAVMFSHGPTRQIVISAANNEDARSMTGQIDDRFLPFATLVVNTGDNQVRDFVRGLKGRDAIERKPTAYICQNFACLPPVTGVDQLAKMLDA
jgi:uncharacterized protein YyaL (SSP411 family)